MAGFWLLTILQFVLILLQLFNEAFLVQPLERGIHVVLALFIFTQVRRTPVETVFSFTVVIIGLVLLLIVFHPGFFRLFPDLWRSGTWSDTHKANFISGSLSCDACPASWNSKTYHCRHGWMYIFAERHSAPLLYITTKQK